MYRLFYSTISFVFCEIIEGRVIDSTVKWTMPFSSVLVSLSLLLRESLVLIVLTRDGYQGGYNVDRKISFLLSTSRLDRGEV